MVTMQSIVCLLLISQATTFFQVEAVHIKQPDDIVNVAGQLIEKFDQLQRELAERDKKHEEVVKTLQDEIREQKTWIAKLEDVTARQQESLAILQKENDVINDAIGQVEERYRNNLEQRLNEAEVKSRHRRNENSQDVAFFATTQHHLPALGPNQNVIFDGVVTNIGNAFHSTLGAFIAPVDGIYVFSADITTANTSNAHFGIFHNNTELSTMFVNGMDNKYDSSSQMVVLQLSRNDDVSVRNSGGTGSHGVNGNKHSVFSGFLLSELYLPYGPGITLVG